MSVAITVAFALLVGASAEPAMTSGISMPIQQVSPEKLHRALYLEHGPVVDASAELCRQTYPNFHARIYEVVNKWGPQPELLGQLRGMKQYQGNMQKARARLASTADGAPEDGNSVCEPLRRLFLDEGGTLKAQPPAPSAPGKESGYGSGDGSAAMAYVMLLGAEAECRFLLPGKNDQIDAAMAAVRQRDPEMFARLDGDPSIDGYRERIRTATPDELRQGMMSTDKCLGFIERSLDGAPD